MKTIVLSKRSRDHELKIEAPGCIIIVKIGLHDTEGREVTYASVSADGDRYAGEPEWWIATDNPAVDRRGMGFRIVRHEKQTEPA